MQTLIMSRTRASLFGGALTAILVAFTGACGGTTLEGGSSGGSGGAPGGAGGATGGSTSGGTTSGGSGGAVCPPTECPLLGCGPGTVEAPPTTPCGCSNGCIPACDGVACTDLGCGPGTLPYTPPGECCVTECRTDCSLVDCAQPVCEPGTIPVVKPGACCATCEPDPQRCVEGDTCVIAVRAGQCCACPTPINEASLKADVCWRTPEMSAIPPECVPPNPCGEIACAACEGFTTATCEVGSGKCVGLTALP